MQAVTHSDYLQHTLNNSIHFIGRGLHTGKAVSMTLKPAAANTGYEFCRLDLQPPYNLVPARWLNVSDTRLSTTISNNQGTSVTTVEHLLAALSACGVDNCQIDVDGPEVPIMDGSAKPFVDQILAVGLTPQAAERMAIVIQQPVFVQDGNAQAGFIPFPEPWMDMTIDFNSPLIGKQKMVMPMNPRNFAHNISAARTFGFSEHVGTLKTLGLAEGGALSNAILIDNDEIANPEGLRFEDEFVRHKILDAVGDLALLGVQIVGCFVGERSGHRLNNQLLRSLMYRDRNWTMTTLEDAIVNWEQLTEESINHEAAT
ncbi:UDP-3-O-[3-hydroxymyristoyl] N-acetylglucosamine deacetylase [Aestuariicella hydrocarbonica]|uniref:UDP-3-O-acyl-N-acetylglucosamine deacetylase n=1 Tax=Pseudomaricurvus hydrocarbonicus TaxID=1470433 RepID=A0A9E5T446_9GAMM|nr:UDP-3-O-acyl-N-acetylglucosamine deacetylase [Aestuariicella hydrocarbonica]NHO67667.1 UDP-3-O-[3-hydroxymyristoyl] N-acetylglucosamine deacetylase [Aestuariicella hydrocarbonica]